MVAELRSDSNSSRELIPRSTPPKPAGISMKPVVQESCYGEASCAGELLWQSQLCRRAAMKTFWLTEFDTKL